jgi:hypothetical protein
MVVVGAERPDRVVEALRVDRGEQPRQDVDQGEGGEADAYEVSLSAARTDGGKLAAT